MSLFEGGAAAGAGVSPDFELERSLAELRLRMLPPLFSNEDIEPCLKHNF